MITGISEGKYNDIMGNKAKNLIILSNAGFNVPDGVILDSDEYDLVINTNDLKDKIDALLTKADASNIKTISEDIIKLFDNIHFPENIKTKLMECLKLDALYAVRSSGTKEDLDNFSFAGQYDTFLNVSGVDNIIKAIIDCYKSMFSQVMLSYLINNSIDATNSLKMSVVIQEMVPSDYSGIAFGVNPITGDDKEIVAEVAGGLGENIVSGKVAPDRYCYNWYEDKYTDVSDENKLLSDVELKTLMNTVLDIQMYFGFPCDVEYAFYNKELYILQSRAVTSIKYAGIKDIWSTADFKDGGVSATVCYPYMWSLYEYIWDYTLKKFIIDSKILKPKDVEKSVGDMFYGRPYWNLSVVKAAMSSVPGYKEREFDMEYGVRINYEGDGHTTGITPASIIGIVNIALAQKKILKERNENAQRYKDELLDKYKDYKDKLDNSYTLEELEKVWYTLTHDDYLTSESTYFWQIFINTIHQALYKDSLLKYVSETEYLSLLGGIDNISHLLPFYEMWESTRRMREDKETLNYFANHDDQYIAEHLDEEKYFIPEIKKFIDDYGYHSDKELDVAYPCYYEDVKTVVKMYRDTCALDDNCSPINDKDRQRKLYNAQLDKIKGQVSKGKYSKIETKVTNMRKMLWWREEFRDVSTRFYCIIRAYTVKLSHMYVKEQIFKEPEDIWYLKVRNLWDYIDGTCTKEDLAKVIEKNRKYYKAYKNYISENEIGSVFDTEDVSGVSSLDGYKGIGCNNGVVTATARVIENLDDIDRLQVGDILVTRYTDTGWTCKFALLSGIVTEYGGILCHAAIVSREYGIPCIVCAHDIMKKIKDGSTITIDGTTGEIRKVEG